MPSVPKPLLDQPPEVASRLLALAFLDEAAAARARLQDSKDTEALHDCRVGMRRLRSCLRAFRPWLEGSVSKKMRTRLREIAATTNPGRDAEVQVEWLQAQKMAPRQREGLKWLTARLEKRKRDAYAQATAEVSRALCDLEEQMRARLTTYVAQVHLEGARPKQRFATVVGTLVREHVTDLRQQLAAVHSAEDETQAHEARIRAKRLRYLLEPLCAEVESCRPAVKRIKGLQDVLGELHDVQLLATEVAAALEIAAAEKARRLHGLALQADPEGTRMRRELRHDERPGLLAIAKLVRERRERLFTALATEWLQGGAEAFLDQLDAIGVEIAARAPENREIERKYLLRGLPEQVHGAPCREIEQGWLPGRKWQERLRHTRTAMKETFVRTVKMGEGLERIEVEEPIAPEVFAQLWPFTSTRRVRKLRYDIAVGTRTWEIDHFLDRDLVLAEIELEAADEAVELPAWLAPLVIREVTSEPEYSNVNLALDVGVQSPSNS